MKKGPQRLSRPWFHKAADLTPKHKGRVSSWKYSGTLPPLVRKEEHWTTDYSQALPPTKTWITSFWTPGNRPPPLSSLFSFQFWIRLFVLFHHYILESNNLSGFRGSQPEKKISLSAYGLEGIHKRACTAKLMLEWAKALGNPGHDISHMKRTCKSGRTQNTVLWTKVSLNSYIKALTTM